MFDDESARRVCRVLTMFSAGVWAYIANHTLTRAFYAVGDTRTPMRVSLLMVGINVAMNLGLIWSLGEAGLAVSTALCSALQFGLLTILWKRTSGRPLAPGWITVVPFVMTLVMGGCVLGVSVSCTLPGSTAAPGPTAGFGWPRASRPAAGVYLALAVFLRRPEIRLLLSRNAPGGGINCPVDPSDSGCTLSLARTQQQNPPTGAPDAARRSSQHPHLPRCPEPPRGAPAAARHRPQPLVDVAPRGRRALPTPRPRPLAPVRPQPGAHALARRSGTARARRQRPDLRARDQADRRRPRGAHRQAPRGSSASTPSSRAPRRTRCASRTSAPSSG